MQSSDASDQLVQTAIIQDKNRIPPHLQIAALIQQAEKKGAVKHVIAPLPAADSVVEILGLKYRVTFSSSKRGKLHLELVQPSEASDIDVTTQE